MVEPVFKCRFDELPFLGAIATEFFIRDKSSFITFSPDYKDPFLSNLQAKSTTIKELIASKKVTAEIKKLTQKLFADYTHARNMMNKLERYVDKAFANELSLSINPGDFGFKTARKSINAKDDESIVSNLKFVQKNMDDNFTVLEAKGYTKDVQTELSTLIIDLTKDSLAQTMKKKEREELVRKNMDQLNKYWLMVDDILKTGKSIYKEIDKNKVNDYTYTELIKNVRLTRKKDDTESPDNPKA